MERERERQIESVHVCYTEAGRTPEGQGDDDVVHRHGSQDDGGNADADVAGLISNQQHGAKRALKQRALNCKTRDG